MSSRQEIQRLQTEYPDISQSTIGDVLNTYQNDGRKAADALRGLSNQLKDETDSRVEELQEMFPDLSKKEIEAELQAANGNVDLAIAPLFSKAEDIQNKQKRKKGDEQRKKRQEEEAKRRKEEEKKQAGNLMDIFRNIPKETVQAVLDENEGDIEETTAQLLKVVAVQEEEAKKIAERKRREEQENRLRELKFQALRGKFEDLADAQITDALNKNNWEIQRALGDLTLATIAKKKEEIKDLFLSIEDDTIETALEVNNHDKVKTVSYLTKEREKRRLEEEASSMQDQVEDKKERSNKRRYRRGSKSTKVKKQDDKKTGKDEPEEKKTNPSTSANSSPAAAQPAVIISKVQQNALEKSVLLGQMIEKEVEANHIEDEEKLRVQAHAIFRDNLENIIEKQARGDNLPGMVPPPTPKQIDGILGKPKPVVEIETVNASIQEKELPEMNQSSKPAPPTGPKALVTLAVKQTQIDIGNPITVDWEIHSGVSSAWDWIGLFPVDKSNKQYVTYQWSGKQLMKGSLNFSAPTVYGEYEFRYFPNGYYEHATSSSKFKVGPNVDLNGTLNKADNKIVAQWIQHSGNLYSKSWIALYEKSETNNNNYVAWSYAGKPHTDLIFDAPFKPREYELRFFTNSYVDVARSQPIRIEGNDTITATYENGMVNIKLSVVTIDPEKESGWLGVFFTTEANNKLWRRYKYFNNRIGDCQFKAPRTAGEYEIRMFANKSYDLILKSNKFTIPTEQK